MISKSLEQCLTEFIPQPSHSRILTTILLAGALAIAGCKTTGSTPDEVTYSFFFTPGDHVEELLAGKKVLDASKVYNDQREFFEEDSKSRKTISGKLWTALTGILSSELTKSSSELSTLKWPAPAKKWDGIKRQLKNAEALIGRIDGHDVITNGRFKYPTFTDFKAQVNTAKSKILTDAPNQFQIHQISKAPNFFTQYPVKISPPGFLKTNARDLEDRLDDASVDGIRHVYKNYGKDLSKTTSEMLARLHYQRSLASSSAGSAQDQPKRSFQNILTAISDTKKAGLPLKTLPDAKISLVEVTSQTLLREGQIEFATAIKMDLPFHAAKHDIDTAFSNATAKNTDILVLIDVAVARTVRDVHGKESVASQVQVGTRSVQNPAYHIAQNELNAALMRLQAANMGKVGADNQYCDGMACLGKAFAQIAANGRLKSATTDHQDSMDNLAGIPMRIDEPIYRNYEFSKITMKTSKIATVNYYVIDRLGKVYFKDSFDVQDKKEFVVAYKLEKRDRFRDMNLEGTQTEKDVSDFEAQPVTVKLSSILEQFTAKSAKHQPLPSLESIRTEVLKDKNTALAAYRNRTYDIKPKQTDDRFNRVVVVLNPQGSLGTGFYIRDDLILTNFHVVDGAKFVEMKLYNGQETFGKVIAKDVRLDLAVVRVQHRGIPVQFYRKRSLRQGSPVDIIGHPNRLLFSITRGIISAERRAPSLHMNGGKPVHVIQTDAAINGGNSGGPMFLGNEVIGVNTFKRVGVAIEGLNFAVHYSEVFEFLDRKGINIRRGS